MSTTTELQGINFMTKSQFDSQSSLSQNQVYAVEGQFVIETYVNGTSWYRVYSDSFHSEGDIVGAFADNWTITFKKSFNTTEYSLTGEQWGTDATGNLGISSQYTSYAQGNHIGSGNIKVTWTAFGF